MKKDRNRNRSLEEVLEHVEGSGPGALDDRGAVEFGRLDAAAPGVDEPPLMREGLMGGNREARPTRRKVVGAEEMAALAAGYRQAGRTVVFTNGCFDLLHVGHVTCLEEAARLGDVLVVGLNSDESVRALKGPGRPVIPEADRAVLLAALEVVDHVVIFGEDTPLRLLGLVRPDILVKGGTYRVEEVVGRDLVESYGGRVCVTGQTEGISTTQILASLARQWPDGP